MCSLSVFSFFSCRAGEAKCVLFDFPRFDVDNCSIRCVWRGDACVWIDSLAGAQCEHQRGDDAALHLSGLRQLRRSVFYVPEYVLLRVFPSC